MFLNLPIEGSTSSGLIISCSSLKDILPLSLCFLFLCSVLSPVVAMTTRLLCAVLNSVKSSNSFSFSIPVVRALVKEVSYNSLQFVFNRHVLWTSLIENWEANFCICNYYLVLWLLFTTVLHHWLLCVDLVKRFQGTFKSMVEKFLTRWHDKNYKITFWIENSPKSSLSCLFSPWIE